MKTMGWVVKSSGGTYYWTDEDSNISLRSKARVFLTKFEAFSVRDTICSKSCCKVYRITHRRVDNTVGWILRSPLTGNYRSFSDEDYWTENEGDALVYPTEEQAQAELDWFTEAYGWARSVVQMPAIHRLIIRKKKP